MVLELREGGRGKFATSANLGDPQLNRGVEATMSVPEGKWAMDGGEGAGFSKR